MEEIDQQVLDAINEVEQTTTNTRCKFDLLTADLTNKERVRLQELLQEKEAVFEVPKKFGHLNIRHKINLKPDGEGAWAQKAFRYDDAGTKIIDAEIDRMLDLG